MWHDKFKLNGESSCLKKLLKSLKSINHKLFFALLIMGLVPVI